MHPPYLTDEAINDFIDAALREDVGEGDHSSLATIPINTIGKGRLFVKDDGIIAGLDMAQRIFHRVNPALHLEFFKRDGDSIYKGEIAFEVTGSAQAILTAERLVLNCMQRMSGIATYTQRLCKMIDGTRAQLLDTRKTTPNFRLMEKWAVSIGGGHNHRFALYDMVMLKDNHVDMAGGISNAIEHANAYVNRLGKRLKIEVETRSMQEVQEVLKKGGVDVIMLDNFPLEELSKAVQLINNRFKTEASGGINEVTLRAVAETGVDYISVGALTHSAKSLDLSLKTKPL
ncbi:MAG: carboxylating nicotinate-nucleotide diphosphorylase [Bacteroidetes bacterium]|nr:carboxylating nicotinate-nucleotide diphosphorylase [Bacteroidota bacterium]